MFKKCSKFFISILINLPNIVGQVTLQIQNIKPNIYNIFSKINFKGAKNIQPAPDFEDNYRRFSNTQRNSRICEIDFQKHNAFKLPVNFRRDGDSYYFLNLFNSNIENLKFNQKNLAAIDADYTLQGCIVSDKGYTNGILDCIAVLLYNDEKGYLFHLNSYSYEQPKYLKEMQGAFEDAICDLEEGGKSCRCFLFGGVEEISEKLYENISKALDEFDIKKDEAVFSNGNNSYSIYFDIDEGIILSDNMHAFKSKYDLEKRFNKVNISS